MANDDSNTVKLRKFIAKALSEQALSQRLHELGCDAFIPTTDGDLLFIFGKGDTDVVVQFKTPGE